MTAPAPYDPRVLRHPEYARSYHHYLGQGSPPDRAARLAYDWTRRSVPGLAMPAPSDRGPLLVIGGIGATAFLAIVIAVAAQPSGPPDTIAVRPQSSAATSPAAEPSASPSPSPSPSTESPSPSAVPTTVPPVPAPVDVAPKVTVPKPTAARPAPPRKTVPKPPVKPQGNCNPAYPTKCLKDGIGDYDCSSGKGNGPNYAVGPLTVRAPDPFELDSDGDGIGCERG